jgi:predicted lipid-binding transport protein (Tim44 family)
MDHVKTLFRIGAISVGLVLASTAAEAKGCIRGAIVGGLGGHFVGRGLEAGTARHAGRWPTILGAATGCIVGRYEANRRARAAARPAQPPQATRSAQAPATRSAQAPATRTTTQAPATRSTQPPALGSAQALRSRSIHSGR